jgi:hypothetical protein
MNMQKIAVNAEGRRVGEDHPNARLTNDEVDLLLDMHAAGYSYGKLAVIFEVAKATVQGIVTGRYRSQTPARFK